VDPNQLRMVLAAHMHPGAQGKELEAFSKEQGDPVEFFNILLHCCGACQVRRTCSSSSVQPSTQIAYS
jgi:hypothetical protein